jgi:metal-sulfur cluster biosynthetic enzyme
LLGNLFLATHDDYSQHNYEQRASNNFDDQCIVHLSSPCVPISDRHWDDSAIIVTFRRHGYHTVVGSPHNTNGKNPRKSTVPSKCRPRIIKPVPAPAPTSVLTEAAILAALRDCYDPDISLNIVDLGLVHSISITPDPDAPGAGIPGVPPRHRVSIALTLAQLASPSDPQDTPLIAQIQNRLAAFETVSRTEVALLREPAWNPGRISPEGRARLGNHLPSNKPASTKTDALIQIQSRPAKSKT